MSSPLQQGAIVWVTIPDPRGGNPKARPAVILTATADIDPNGEVQVAAITTLIGQAPFAETVELPATAAGHPQTKLKKPCEVVCSWVVLTPTAVAPFRRISSPKCSRKFSASPDGQPRVKRAIWLGAPTSGSTSPSGSMRTA